jgi:lysophospholipase L1-like esterase
VTVTAAPDVIHGVAGVSHFRVNRFGIRGRPFGDDGAEYRILAVGGSTTECRVLDDAKAWTHLLEADLNRTGDGKQVWVGNVGRRGATTRDHVLHLKYLLPQYPHVDVVVSLVGVNDMVSALQQGWGYRLPALVTDPGAESEQLERAFARVPGRVQDARPTLNAPWYKATALWQLARRVKLERNRSAAWRGGGLGFLQQARLLRHDTGEWIDSLPPLEGPLIEYRRNLNQMADLAAAARVRLVFVTQPSAWRDGMSDAEERLLWFGWSGRDRRSYFTTGALSRAMARYNRTLLEVCRERGLDCVDAARVVPQDTTALYDDVHLNDHGSLLLARVLVTHFRARPPFHRSD